MEESQSDISIQKGMTSNTLIFTHCDRKVRIRTSALQRIHKVCLEVASCLGSWKANRKATQGSTSHYDAGPLYQKLYNARQVPAYWAALASKPENLQSPWIRLTNSLNWEVLINLACSHKDCTWKAREANSYFSKHPACPLRCFLMSCSRQRIFLSVLSHQQGQSPSYKESILPALFPHHKLDSSLYHLNYRLLLGL